MADDATERRKTVLEGYLRELNDSPKKPRDVPAQFVHENNHERPEANQPYYWVTPERRDRDRLLVPRRPRMLGTSNSDTPNVYRSGEVIDRNVYLQSGSPRPASLPPDDRLPKPVEQSKKQEKSDAKPRQEYLSPSLPQEVETVYNSANTKDVTVHLEFDLVSDIDEELEEFNRLVRLGDFHNANLFFHDHLKHHASDAFVFVQYAEMLLDQGDFKSVLQLDPSETFRAPNDRGGNSSLENLNWNWRLIRATALSFGQFELQPVWREVEKLMDVVAQNPGSTELRILSLSLRLRKLAPHPMESLPGNIEWSKIYQHLLAQDRIWDFKDLFVAFSLATSTVEAMNAFFKSNKPLEDMVADWQTPEPDESTELALLEIISFMAISVNTSSEVRPFAERCLESADAIGDSLLRNFPLTIKSRPVLQWLIAKAAVSARMGPRSPLAFDYLSDYPGQAVLPKRLGIPYYIPVRQENPGWSAPELPIASRQPLELALEGARQLKDYHTEGLCLKELIVRSRDPTILFDKLGSLQKSVQGNMDGYLTTCLSRYLMCRDDTLKKRLLADLAEFGDWNDPRDLISPAKAATRDIMQRALSPAPQIGFVPNSIKAGLRYYDELPAFFQRMIDDHVLRRTATADYQRRPIVQPKTPQRVIIRDERPVRGRSTSRHRPKPGGDVINKEGQDVTKNDRSGDPADATQRVFEPNDMTEKRFDPSVNVLLPDTSGLQYDLGGNERSDSGNGGYYMDEHERTGYEGDREYYSDNEQERSRTPPQERGRKLATAVIDALADKAKERVKKWEEDMDRREPSRSPSETRGRTRTRSGSRRRSRSRPRYTVRSRTYSRSTSRSRERKGKSGISKFIRLAAAAAGAAVAARAYDRSESRRGRDSEVYRDRSRSRSRTRSRNRARGRSVERHSHGKHHEHTFRDRDGNRNSEAPQNSEKRFERKVPPPLPPREFSAPQPIVEEIETDQESRPTSGHANEGRDPHLMFAAESAGAMNKKPPEAPLETNASKENNVRTEGPVVEPDRNGKVDEGEDHLAKTDPGSSEYAVKAG